MFVAAFIIIYLALNVLLAVEVYLWIKAFKNPFRFKTVKVIFTVVYTFFTSLILVAFFMPDSEMKKAVSRITNYYLGFLINLLIVISIAHISAIVIKKIKKLPKEYFRSGRPKIFSGIVCLLSAVVFSFYGFINANCIKVSSYDISVDKPGEDMKIVLVADTHLGYSIGEKNMRDMAEKINALKPDLVCFAGDIFDNDFDSLDDPKGIKQAFLSIESRYGNYACWGNHDVTEKLIGGFSVSSGGNEKIDERMKAFLKESEIIMLADELTVVENKFTLIGRRDMSKPADGIENRFDIEDFKFDKTKPVICMDHEPSQLQEKADAGIDIDLGGHTHNGQFFPLCLGMGFIWENPTGCITRKSEDGHVMHNIVTEGVGVYGPFMRTFTNSEIVEINVDFKD